MVRYLMRIRYVYSGTNPHGDRQVDTDEEEGGQQEGGEKSGQNRRRAGKPASQPAWPAGPNR